MLRFYRVLAWLFSLFGGELRFICDICGEEVTPSRFEEHWERYHG